MMEYDFLRIKIILNSYKIKDKMFQLNGLTPGHQSMKWPDKVFVKHCNVVTVYNTLNKKGISTKILTIFNNYICKKIISYSTGMILV